LIDFFLQNAIPVLLLGFYTSALITLSKGERLVADFSLPMSTRVYRWLLKCSPLALFLAVFFLLIVLAVRYFHNNL